MDDENEDGMEEALLTLLGPDGFVLLAEKFGGLRAYVPHKAQRCRLTDEITLKYSEKIVREYGGSYIKVPIGRDFRAQYYREKGLRTGKIARLLGITESGVDKIFMRLRRVDLEGVKDVA